MTNLDPLKSTISILEVDDTSLAMPSVNQHRSGQQRVLEQVQTIRMNKSRRSSSRTGSTSLSPTSPVVDAVFESSKSSTNAADVNVFFANGISKALSLDRSMNQQVTKTMNVKRTTGKRNTSASILQHKTGYLPLGYMATGLNNTSRSDFNLAWQLSKQKLSVPPQRLPSKKSSHTSTGQFIVGTISKLHPGYTENGTMQTKEVGASKTSSKLAPNDPGSSGTKVGGISEMTMKEAVECLSRTDQTYQLCGASYIQHNTFIDDKAKEQVLKLNGIPPLVSLLRSPSFQINHTASAALRNLSFKNNRNKEEIHRYGGITEAVTLLRGTDSAEMQKQLTGLLWNLSSSDSLKPDLLKSALPALMDRVILPYTAGSDLTDSDAESFFHATGCLRNLSSARQNNRQVMRTYRGLIDSLVRYIQDCVEAEKPDLKSVENCVCVLHNLTFQLESEAPALFSRITALKRASRRESEGDASAIGCFIPQNKCPVHKRHFDFPITEDSQPTGAGLLIHSKVLQSYLSLLGSSQQEETQEACCGVLQNLTASKGIVSDVMSQMIVQKLNGLQVLSPLVTSSKVNIQRNTVALIRNLARNPNLHNAIAHKCLPELMSVLSAGTKEENKSDDTLAMACQAVNRVVMTEPEMSKRLLNTTLIKSLSDLSRNIYLPKSQKAAAVLLYNLWSDKDLQNFLKKQGMSKSLFVNDTTAAALQSMQVGD